MRNMKNSRAPPTGVSRLALMALAMLGTTLRQLGKPGASLEKWALKKLGAWPTAETER